MCCTSTERREEDKEWFSKLFLWSAAWSRQEGRSSTQCLQCGNSQAWVGILLFRFDHLPIRTDGPAFSLAPRMKAEKVYVTPAPSTYDMRKPEVVRVRAPAYSLAGRFLTPFHSAAAFRAKSDVSYSRRNPIIALITFYFLSESFAS